MKHIKVDGRQLKTCVNKVRYHDEPSAWKGAENTALKFRIKLRIYKCPYCQGYHLTRRI